MIGRSLKAAMSLIIPSVKAPGTAAAPDHRKTQTFTVSSNPAIHKCAKIPEHS